MPAQLEKATAREGRAYLPARGRPAPLVLGGPPRSGTTLLSALLDGHPAINWLPDEGYFFEHLYTLGRENFDRFARAARFGTEALIEGLRDRALMPPTHRPLADFPALRLKWSEERFRAVLAREVPQNVRELWALLCDAYLAALGEQPRRYVSMKAADYGRSAFGALELLPEARAIVMVREPVAALNSLKAYRARRGEKLLTWPTLVEAVVAMNRLAELVDRYRPGRLTVIRYEDLVASPEQQTRCLCSALDLPFDPALTRPSMMGVAWSNNSSFAEGAAGEAALPGRRPVALASPELEYVVHAAEPFRSRFGYLASAPP